MCLCSSGTPDHLSAFPYPVAELTPQARGMVLLDRVLEAGDDFLVAELTVRDDGLFSTAEATVPAWVGLEYMAQTIAAFSGYQRKLRGEAIGLGFLLGTRQYQCSTGHFLCGQRLTVRAERVIEAANDMSVFACVIEGERVNATAALNVLLPQDSKKFLAEKGV